LNDIEYLNQVENSLNNISYKGAPLGALVGIEFQYIHKKIKKLHQVNITADFKNNLKLIKTNRLGHLYLRSKKYKASDLEAHKNKTAITFLSPRPNIVKMGEKMIEMCGADNTVALCLDEKVENAFTKQKPSLLIKINKDFCTININDWRKEFKKIKPLIQNKIELVIKDLNAPPAYKKILMIMFMEQTQLYQSWFNFFSLLKPKCVITESDRYPSTVPIIIAAKNFNIKTYSLMHGVIFDIYAYLPMVADYLLVWGELQKRHLVEFGGDPETIIPVGAPQLDEKISGDISSVKRMHKINPEDTVVLLATNNLNPALIKKLTEIFCEAISQVKNVKGLVKLHPSEKISSYEEFILKYPGINFYSKDDLSFNDSFLLSDIICTYSTAFAFDAIIKNKPLIIINVDTEHLGISKQIIENGGLKPVENAEELIEAIKNCGKTQSKELQLFKNDYCMALNGEAVKNINYTINKTLKVA